MPSLESLPFLSHLWYFKLTLQPLEVKRDTVAPAVHPEEDRGVVCKREKKGEH